MSKFIEVCSAIMLFLILNLLVMGAAWLIVEKEMITIVTLISFWFTYSIMKKRSS